MVFSDENQEIGEKEGNIDKAVGVDHGSVVKTVGNENGMSSIQFQITKINY